MSEVKIEEYNWEELQELRDSEPNSYSIRQAQESYEESKEEQMY